jgi:hypothetical protein
MYKVEKDQRVYAIRVDGMRIEFSSYTKLLTHLEYDKGGNHLNIRVDYRISRVYNHRRGYTENVGNSYNDTYVVYLYSNKYRLRFMSPLYTKKNVEWIIKDAENTIIDTFKIKRDLLGIGDRYVNYHWYCVSEDSNYLGFRNGPVPGVHGYGNSGGKAPRVMQEIKSNISAAEEGFIVRGSRRRRELPDSWDYDDWVYNRYGKSWKRDKKRKKQWMR